MVNNHKKKAVALVLIVMVVTSLSLLVMGSIKVLTRTHTKYTTGVSRNGEINANQSRGKFICYRDENGQLQQKTVRYRSNGDIENNPALNRVHNGNCIFTIPNQANSFKITLIGAGGGGSIANVTFRPHQTPTENGEDSIFVGNNATTFYNIFQNNKYISRNDILTVQDAFFSNLTAIVKASDKDDPTGGTRSVNLSNLFGGYRNLINKTVDYFTSNMGGSNTNWNLRIKKANGTRDYHIRCYGGATTLPNPNKDVASPFGAYSSNIMYETIFGLKGSCNTYNGFVSNVNNRLEHTTSTEEQDDNILFRTNYNGTNYTAKKGEFYGFRIKHHEANVFESRAGKPGEITIFESRFIAPSGQATLTIRPSNLGTGGTGGTGSTLNGGAGGATTLVVTTNVGEQTIRANGGAGGQTQQTETLGYYPNIPSQLDLTKEQTYLGQNGKAPDVVISSDFGLTNLSAGLSTSETGDRIAAATLPGSSGASGSLVWNSTTLTAARRIREAAASPYIMLIHPDVPIPQRINGEGLALRTSINFPAILPINKHTTGGAGASGAIIIEW